MGEYGSMINASAMIATLFLGGWQGPWLPGIVWFLIKIGVLLFIYIWLRASLPRFRYDQLMRFGWGILLPLALLNIFITGIAVVG